MTIFYKMSVRASSLSLKKQNIVTFIMVNNFKKYTSTQPHLKTMAFTLSYAYSTPPLSHFFSFCSSCCLPEYGSPFFSKILA